MRFQTGYLYFFATAFFFWAIAIWVWFNPDTLGNIPYSYRQIICIVLVLWGGFRAVSGYLAYKRKKQDED